MCVHVLVYSMQNYLCLSGQFQPDLSEDLKKKVPTNVVKVDD